jgi:hypothetical protein
MVIDTVYKKYFQKSKIFMYPLLGIKKGSSVTPVQTYVSWEGHYKPEDAKLIATYHKREDPEYLNFEKNILLKHNRLIDRLVLDSETVIFVFDYSDVKTSWEHFLNGKYSQIELKLRRKIRDFFPKNSGNHVYVDSYLFPEKYFELYSELLQWPVEQLKEVGELCTPPDLEQETLTAQLVNLEKQKIID